MRWRRAFAAGLLAIPMLVAASPAGAIEVPPPYPIPPWCKRTITISPVSMHEGTVSPHDAGFTWFRFTVGAPGCILTG
ncbi:MAG TPA: hypothetical protein VF062_11450, partial [Candidatus Limnocylindrales bacterium]